MEKSKLIKVNICFAMKNFYQRVRKNFYLVINSKKDDLPREEQTQKKFESFGIFFI